METWSASSNSCNVAGKVSWKESRPTSTPRFSTQFLAQTDSPDIAVTFAGTSNVLPSHPKRTPRKIQWSKDRIYRHELVTCGRMGCLILRLTCDHRKSWGDSKAMASIKFIIGVDLISLQEWACPINRNLMELINLFRILWVVLDMLSLREVMESQQGFSLSAGIPQVEVTLLLTWCNMETLGTPMPWNPSVKAPWQSSNVQLFPRVSSYVGSLRLPYSDGWAEATFGKPRWRRPLPMRKMSCTWPAPPSSSNFLLLGS